MQRVLQGVAGKLRFTNLDQDGIPTASAGAVTVKVVRADGTEVLPAGSATTAGAGAGEYERALTPVQLSTLDRLTATWSDAGDGSAHVTETDVAGGVYFNTTEGRALDSAFTEAAYPTAAVVACRDAVEDAIESICGRSFVPRFAQETHSGDGSTSLWIGHLFPRTVRSLTVGGVAFSGAELGDLGLDDAGELVRLTLGRFASGNRNLVVAYEHGEDAPPPLIRRAALLLFKAWLPAFRDAGGSPGGLVGLSVEGLSLRFGASAGDTTGIDAVDRLITMWRGTSPVFA